MQKNGRGDADCYQRWLLLIKCRETGYEVQRSEAQHILHGENARFAFQELSRQYRS